MNVYETKQAERKERYLARSKKLNNLSDELYNDGRRKLSAIPFGQPILVGHHSEKADRSYRSKACAKIDKSFKLSEKAEYYQQRAESVGTGGISSDDEDVKKKLLSKIETLEKVQERMKQENKDARQKGLDQPYAGFQLSNNNANIRSTKKRLERIEKLESIGQIKPVEGNGWTLQHNVELNRLQFLFDDKPDAETRSLLKSKGYKWSPANKAWQRMVTPNAIYRTRILIKELKSL